MKVHKLTNNIIDERLKGRNINRISEVVNGKTKINFKCLVCDYVWLALPRDIVCDSRLTGCPRCAHNFKLTNEIIDERLIDRNIKRVGNYSGADTKIDFQCLVEDCNNIWKVAPSTVISHNVHSCPQCFYKTRKFDNDILDERIKELPIKRIGSYIDWGTKIDFLCLVNNCNHIWSTTPAHIYNDTGCPKCAGNLPLTNEDVDEYLKDRNIKRVGSFVSTATKIDFKCLDCDNIWSAKTANVIYLERGCPNCSIGKNEKLVFALIKDNAILVETHKDIRKVINYERRIMYVDFYLPSSNTIIEYNGEQHYRPVRFGGMSIFKAEANFCKQQERDTYLQKICDNDGIELIWIDGRKFCGSKLKQHMIDNILPAIRNQ
jgi:hypothetical protein